MTGVQTCALPIYPAHVAQIAALTATAALVPTLRSQLHTLQSTPAKVVERIVDRPVDRIVEKIVEKIVDRPVDRVVEKIVDRPVDRVVEKIVDRPVDRVIEKIVEKRVDNPAHVAQIAALTATAA